MLSEYCVCITKTKYYGERNVHLWEPHIFVPQIRPAEEASTGWKATWALRTPTSGNSGTVGAMASCFLQIKSLTPARRPWTQLLLSFNTQKAVYMATPSDEVQECKRPKSAPKKLILNHAYWLDFSYITNWEYTRSKHQAQAISFTNRTVSCGTVTYEWNLNKYTRRFQSFCTCIWQNCTTKL